MELLLIPILWVVLSAVVATTADNRGGFGWAWFIGSLLFSPLLCFLLLMASPKNQDKIDALAIKNGVMKKCPRCAEIIKRDALVCKHCGHEF
jgi:hypothetical protein